MYLKARPAVCFHRAGITSHSNILYPPSPPLFLSVSSFSVRSEMFFPLLCFHLDWSVEHFVSLLSNHFKNARTQAHRHTHTRTHTHTHIHTHTHTLFWCPNLLLYMRERVSFDTPKLFFLNASHFLMLLSWLSLQVGRAAVIWDTLLFFSLPPFFFFPSPVLFICWIFRTNN